MNSVEITPGFGTLIDGVEPADLSDPSFQDKAREMWRAGGGLLAVRGEQLAGIEPELLMTWSGVFGAVEQVGQTARERSMVNGFPIMRIGNVRDENGELKASLARVPQLTSDEDVRYNPATRRPVWHTDSTFREHPPIGSVFHCKQAPASGGETLFADTRRAFAALPADTQTQLRSLEAVCSLAHHDKKINSYSPDYPILSAEQRAANPPRRVPVVLEHPDTGVPALYGLNSSTCAVVPKGKEVSNERMDDFDLEGVEDDSVMILRDLLPHITGPEFTVKWRWQPGDIVVWDNR
ncbi:MAG: TauD/TfdA family dioxygenase, partial [Gammaproteobacteria bacterium]|nr:TauD/TfdA family dioxygenase [Gammaproteobacteria bacterium]